MKLAVRDRTIENPLSGFACSFGATSDGRLILPAALAAGDVVMFRRDDRVIPMRFTSVEADAVEVERAPDPPTVPGDPERKAKFLDDAAKAAAKLAEDARDAEASGKAGLDAAAKLHAEAAAAEHEAAVAL